MRITHMHVYVTFVIDHLYALCLTIMAYLHEYYGDTLGSSLSDMPHLHHNNLTTGLQLIVSGSGGKASAA